MKKILIVGAHGTLGQAISQALSHHQLIKAGSRRGDTLVDLTDGDSIRALFERIGKVDAIISATGKLHFGPLAEMSAEQFRVGLKDKLMGQVELALIGQHYLNAGGSITLTSGIVSEQPIRFGSNASAVNSALEGFVRGAAAELDGGRRINVVSPNVLQESWEQYRDFFPGFEAVPAARAALAYVRSVEGVQTGQTLRVW